MSLKAYKALVQRMAEQYSSVANISSAHGAVTVSAAGSGGNNALELSGGLPEEPDTANYKKPCKWWKSGTCWRGAKCRFQHSGKPGVHVRGRVRSSVSGRGVLRAELSRLRKSQRPKKSF